MDPTYALTRSMILVPLLGILALIASRPGLIMLAVPFVLHIAWALWRRPGVPIRPRVSPTSVMLPEGESVELKVTSQPGLLTTVQWPQVGATTFDPSSGTVLDLPEPSVNVTVETERWGRYHFGPAIVSMTDLSGSWHRAAATDTITATVRPAALKLEGGSGVRNPIGIVGAHKSRHRGDGSELADVRAFHPGDRLRHINWRVTSRRENLHVNSMLTERDTDVLIVTDTLYDVAPADPSASTSLDLVVSGISAITQHYVGFGDRVGVHDLGRRIGRIRPSTGPRQSKVVISRLARARREGGEQYSLQRVPTIASGTLVFFCSPLLEPVVIDELVRLRRLGGEVIAVDTLPEGVGQVDDIDDFDPESFLGEAWLARRMERDEIVARLQSRGIPTVAWRGPGSLAAILLAMEAARSAPRGRR